MQALDALSLLSQRFGMQISELAPGLNAEPSFLCGTTSDLFPQNQFGLQESSAVHDKHWIPDKYECKWMACALKKAHYKNKQDVIYNHFSVSLLI